MTDPCAGDYGSTYTFQIMENGVPVDVSTAISKLVILVRPDASYKSAALTFVTNGIDGKVQYVTIAGDLDPNFPGQYVMQVMVQLPSGKWYTTTYTFTARPRIAPV